MQTIPRHSSESGKVPSAKAHKLLYPLASGLVLRESAEGKADSERHIPPHSTTHTIWY